MSTLHVSDIIKKFRGASHNAVDGVSLRVEPGELLALIGGSGSGKTTLLRIVAGLETQDGGRVEIDDREVSGNGLFVPPEKRHVGMVFQEYALFPHLNVTENIRFGISRLPRDEQRARIREVLNLVGLAGLENRFPHELSGGQQQRVALARSLAPQPAILLLDEPFSNLDRSLAVRLRDEVASIIRRTGTTCVLVTHDVEDALAIADRLALLRDGKLEQLGSPREMYNQPVNANVAAFLGAVNLIPAKIETGATLKTILGNFEPASLPGEGTNFTVGLRPEQIAVSTTSSAGSVAATVTAVHFGGRSNEADISIPGSDQTIMVYLSPSLDIKAGSTVYLSPDWSLANVFPDS